MCRFGLLGVFLFIVACGSTEADDLIEDRSFEAAPKAVVTGAGGDVAADAGFLSDGDVIGIPSGFTADQCVFTAALSAVGGQAISTRVSVNKTTGEVTCKALVQERKRTAPKEKSCSASYTVICTK